jgi:hypothetical protein
VRAWNDVLFLDLLACDDEMKTVPKFSLSETDRLRVNACSNRIRQDYLLRNDIVLRHFERAQIRKLAGSLEVDQVSIVNQSIWPRDLKVITEPLRTAIKNLRGKKGSVKSRK